MEPGKLKKKYFEFCHTASQDKRVGTQFFSLSFFYPNYNCIPSPGTSKQDVEKKYFWILNLSFIM